MKATKSMPANEFGSSVVSMADIIHAEQVQIWSCYRIQGEVYQHRALPALCNQASDLALIMLS